MAKREEQRTDDNGCESSLAIASLLVQTAAGYQLWSESRREAINEVEALADEKEGGGLRIDFLVGFLTDLASALTAGISTVVLGAIKEPGLSFLSKKALSALASKANDIAVRTATKTMPAAASEKTQNRLIFIAARHEVTRESFEAGTVFRENVEATDFVPTSSVREVAEQFKDAEGKAMEVQRRETRRAWLVFQAQRALGVTPGGVTVTPDAKEGGTMLTVEGAGGTPGVLQVEIDDQLQIVSAELPGLGMIEAYDMRTRPLGTLKIPIRFAREEWRGTRWGIFVNENGQAVAQGPTIDRYLREVGGGRRAEDGDLVDQDQPFINAGLKRVAPRLLALVLGEKLELPTRDR